MFFKVLRKLKINIIVTLILLIITIFFWWLYSKYVYHNIITMAFALFWSLNYSILFGDTYTKGYNYINSSN